MCEKGNKQEERRKERGERGFMHPPLSTIGYSHCTMYMHICSAQCENLHNLRILRMRNAISRLHKFSDGAEHIHTFIFGAFVLNLP